KYKTDHRKEFQNSISDFYWSSSVYSHNTGSAWYMNSVDGRSFYTYKTDAYFVRCARAGQISTLSFYTSKKYKLYKSANGKKRIVKKVSYSKQPFKEIENITQEVTNLYLQPRKIPRKILNRIQKPNLPTLPKFVKGEYETKVQFQERVNGKIKDREEKIKQLQAKYRRDVENRNTIISKLSKEIELEQKYKKTQLKEKILKFQKGAFKTIMGGFKFEKRSYDVETGTMYVTMKANDANYSKKVSLKVSPSQAKAFSDNIKTVKAEPTFEFKNNLITLKSIKANYDGANYLAVLNSKDFKPEKISVAIKDTKVKFDSAKQMRLSLQNPNLKDTYEIKALAYKDGKEIQGQSFDDDIPALLSKIKATKIDSKKWLFVVGIEDYSETDDIKYSKRSALAFKKVAQKTLGIKERNSYTLINNKATGTAIKNKLRILLSEVKKGDTIYFYYNGHGIPNASQGGEPYLLPSDAIPDFIVSEKEFSLKNIYKQLSDSKASKVVAFVDSCFSGATDGVSIIKGVAGSRLAPKRVKFDTSKMVVLTAGQKKQYSNMYEEKGHRMFSYFVMKSLLEGKKDVNMLYKEVSYKVSEASNELGALKKQEPTLDGNRKIKL
ncbi:MAG: caspase family protein, partial [Sulfurimonas sp.]|nr:caspase family protein [Sulfurimonas sp.]